MAVFSERPSRRLRSTNSAPMLNRWGAPMRPPGEKYPLSSSYDSPARLYELSISYNRGPLELLPARRPLPGLKDAFAGDHADRPQLIVDDQSLRCRSQPFGGGAEV